MTAPITPADQELVEKATACLVLATEALESTTDYQAQRLGLDASILKSKLELLIGGVDLVATERNHILVMREK